MPLGLFASRAFVGLTVLTFLLSCRTGRSAGSTSLCADRSQVVIRRLLRAWPYFHSPGHWVGIALDGADRRDLGPTLAAHDWTTGNGPGLVLIVRVTPQATYWASILPAILVIACGMAGAVAPLTTAVLSSVDDRHTATASGFNSAIARTGGLIATALAGGVIAQSGATLVADFTPLP